MSAKDHCLLSKNNNGKIGKTALTWNDQYNNINLNQNQKCEDLKIVHSESKPFYSSRNNNIVLGTASSTVIDSLNCNQYDSIERKLTFSRKKNDTLKPFGDFYFTQKEEERYESQNKNNEISSKINSTLSLHIEAYENSAEAQNVNADDFMMKKSKQDAFNKFLMNVKSTVAIQDTFEFPRQQTEEPMKPEVMQFKATQKLRNPSFLNEGENKSSEEWKSSTKRDAYVGMNHELEKLLDTAPNDQKDKYEKELSGFKRLFRRFLEAKQNIEWNNIQPLPENAIHDYSQLPNVNAEDISKLLDKLVVVKLNGGLGTSMGCKGPKSVISVRNDLTFLDLTMQQIQHLNNIYGVSVPLVLMNSFNTDDDTNKVLKKYANVRVQVHTFCQSQYLRINRETFTPLVKDLKANDHEAYYPPGHGNFYEAFYNSGLLQKFIDQGKEYIFLSNIDNLGATVDLNILNYIVNGSQKPEFVMEVTDKTRADVKGGTLIQYQSKLTLLEIAQVPKDYVDEFKSISKFRIFNTNNLWGNLAAIKRVIENNELEMEVIVNPKHLDRGVDVIQLETAAGAAIKSFRGACGINVPRSRFLPVKKSSDLLLLMSNLYDINFGNLTLSDERSFPTTPLVKLGSQFDKVNDFLKRFQSIPDLIELDHLTVSGDVWFGRDVTLKGTVIIIANHGDRIDIPPGTLLENKIVSGNLRILDH